MLFFNSHIFLCKWSFNVIILNDIVQDHTFNALMFKRIEKNIFNWFLLHWYWLAISLDASAIIHVHTSRHRLPSNFLQYKSLKWSIIFDISYVCLIIRPFKKLFDSNSWVVFNTKIRFILSRYRNKIRHYCP